MKYSFFIGRQNVVGRAVASLGDDGFRFLKAYDQFVLRVFIETVVGGWVNELLMQRVCSSCMSWLHWVSATHDGKGLYIYFSILPPLE